MSVIDHENSTIRRLVEKVMKERNIKKYKIFIEGSTDKQDGYLGDIVFFFVSINENEKLSMVLKSTKTNEKLKNILFYDVIYQREFEIYTKVIPTLEEFTKSKKKSGLESVFPKLWLAEKDHDKLFIILENLKSRNFMIHDRKIPMDPSHMRKIFETYGRWHGTVMALRDQHSKKFYKMVDKWLDPRARLIETFGFVKSFGDEIKKVKKMLIERGRIDLIAVITNIENQIEDTLLRKNLNSKDSLVISHGDNWNNNYMFKYENNNGMEPTQAYLLDFQFSKLDTPVFDLSSAFYNMGNKKTYEDFDNLLSIYHESLSDTLVALGSSPDLFTMNDLKRHWKEHSLFAVLNSFVYSRTALCDADEAPDFIAMAEQGKSFYGVFMFETKNMDLIWDRILNAFIHYAELQQKFN